MSAASALAAQALAALCDEAEHWQAHAETDHAILHVIGRLVCQWEQEACALPIGDPVGKAWETAAQQVRAAVDKPGTFPRMVPQ